MTMDLWDALYIYRCDLVWLSFKKKKTLKNPLSTFLDGRWCSGCARWSRHVTWSRHGPPGECAWLLFTVNSFQLPPFAAWPEMVFFIIIYFYRLSLLIRFWSWWRLWIQRESAMLVRYLCKRVFQSESDVKTCRLAGWTRWQRAWVWSQTLPTRKSRKPWRESERRSRSSRLRSSPAVSTSSPKHTTATFPSLFDKVQK